MRLSRTVTDLLRRAGFVTPGVHASHPPPVAAVDVALACADRGAPSRRLASEKADLRSWAIRV
jgi:hypothetical protein